MRLRPLPRSSKPSHGLIQWWPVVRVWRLNHFFTCALTLLMMSSTTSTGRELLRRGWNLAFFMPWSGLINSPSHQAKAQLKFLAWATGCRPNNHLRIGRMPGACSINDWTKVWKGREWLYCCTNTCCWMQKGICEKPLRWERARAKNLWTTHFFIA